MLVPPATTVSGSGPLFKLASTFAVGMTGWITYDYKTCHPMREMRGYDVTGAFIRLHNTFRPAFTISKMSLKDLSDYDGNDGKTKCYFSSEGWIWDVSNAPSFHGESAPYGVWKGRDASVALAKMSMDAKDVDRTDWESLTDAEWKSLESWTDYFQQKYLIKGKLEGFPRRR